MTRSRSSFTLGMKTMNKSRREAIYAVYAFARVVDDIADEEGILNEKRTLLEAWRGEIDHLYNGTPQSLIGKALLGPVQLFSLPKQEFIFLIEGMETDVNGPVIAPSMEELLSYTRRVAGTVGMLSIRIFGVSDKEPRDRFALNLADALQLTNILRDVEEDAEIGRLYLPGPLLREHGISDINLQMIKDEVRIRQVCREVGKIARARFIEARKALLELKGEPVRPALMMMGVYETYLDRMEHHDFARDPALYKLTKWQKLGHGLRYAFIFPNRPLPDQSETVPPLASLGAP